MYDCRRGVQQAGQGGGGRFLYVYAADCQVSVSVSEIRFEWCWLIRSDSGLAVPMIHAVLPSGFSGSGIKNVTVVQGNPVTQALLMDSNTYYLYK